MRSCGYVDPSSDRARASQLSRVMWFCPEADMKPEGCGYLVAADRPAAVGDH